MTPSETPATEKAPQPKAESALVVRLRVALRVGATWGRRWWRPAAKWAVGLSLAFLVLVRGSMYAYQSMGWSTWPSIGLGVFSTVLLFSGYATWLWVTVSGEKRLRRIVQPVLVAVVAVYGVSGLLYFSSGRSSSPELADQFASLHPLMRLGASVYLLFDRGGVVTDPERAAEDYLEMGLSMGEASLHFKLVDPYVHAMDLRTVGRSTLRNRLTVAYLRIMGFQSLYHVASADHLHVSLPVDRSDTARRGAGAQ